MIKVFGQDIFLAAQATNGIGNEEMAALLNLAKLTKDDFEKLMTYNRLDALVTPGADIAPVLATGGFPGILSLLDMTRRVYITFGGLKGSEVLNQSLYRLPMILSKGIQTPRGMDDSSSKDTLKLERLPHFYHKALA